MDQVTLWNMALQACGTRSTIASVNEGSNEAIALAVQWDNALDCVLAAAHWDFARRQGLLTLLNDATQGQAVPTPWLYEYAYPSDCVQARFIFPQVFVDVPTTTVGTPSAVTGVGSPVRFLVGNDADQQGNDIKVILTNQPQAMAVYTRRVTSPSIWAPQFCHALALYLGSLVCMQITGDKQLALGLFEKADAACKSAAATNGREGLTIIDTIPDWMKVRGYASDWGYPDGGYFSYGPQALTSIQ
jgi:hypothetical protein